MPKIKAITAFEILDSKGNPTIETTVILDNDIQAKAACPSGTSVGGFEALELRDNDPKRFQGKGVLKAIEAVQNLIFSKLIGMEVARQQDIDKAMIELDGTPNKSKLGANSILSVSMAVAEAAAKNENLPLFLYLKKFVDKEKKLKIPTPIFNLINGGLHAGNNINFQEFMVIPATSKTYPEALAIGINVYKALFDILKQNSFSTAVGYEGGYSPALPTNTYALALLKQGLETTSIRFGYDAFLGIDAAANSFFKDKKYYLKEKPDGMTASELIQFYQELYTGYRLLYLEDVFSEDDFEGWSNMCTKMADKSMIVGDDLVATNPFRLQMAIDKKAINAVIIKPNQIGTVIEALAVAEIAKAAGFKVIVSHRSGETNDDFIADFAVAVSADYCKFGAPVRGERVEKYNRLLYIDKQIKKLTK